VATLDLSWPALLQRERGISIVRKAEAPPRNDPPAAMGLDPKLGGAERAQKSPRSKYNFDVNDTAGLLNQLYRLSRGSEGDVASIPRVLANLLGQIGVQVKRSDVDALDYAFQAAIGDLERPHQVVRAEPVMTAMGVLPAGERVARPRVIQRAEQMAAALPASPGLKDFRMAAHQLVEGAVAAVLRGDRGALMQAGNDLAALVAVISERLGDGTEVAARAVKITAIDGVPTGKRTRKLTPAGRQASKQGEVDEKPTSRRGWRFQW
jgi:hypothetical protein